MIVSASVVAVPRVAPAIPPVASAPAIAGAIGISAPIPAGALPAVVVPAIVAAVEDELSPFERQQLLRHRDAESALRYPRLSPAARAVAAPSANARPRASLRDMVKSPVAANGRGAAWIFGCCGAGPEWALNDRFSPLRVQPIERVQHAHLARREGCGFASRDGSAHKRVFYHLIPYAKRHFILRIHLTGACRRRHSLRIAPGGWMSCAGGHMAEVFISYSQKDRVLVAPIAARLSELGVDAVTFRATNYQQVNIMNF